MMAERPHMIADPSTPKTPSVNPRDPNRKPGLHIAIVNPSHHLNDLTRWRSSTTASAILNPSRVDDSAQAPVPAVIYQFVQSGSNGRVDKIVRPRSDQGLPRPVSESLSAGDARA